jgi:hypothetical protein
MKNHLKTIKANREYNKDCFPHKMKVPANGLNKVASMCAEQERFIKLETLAYQLMMFYACNTDTFEVIISNHLKDKINYKEQFIDECCVELAEMVMNKKIYAVPNGLFLAWSEKKSSKDSFVFTYEDALKECIQYQHGGI